MKFSVSTTIVLASPVLAASLERRQDHRHDDAHDHGDDDHGDNLPHHFVDLSEYQHEPNVLPYKDQSDDLDPLLEEFVRIYGEPEKPPRFHDIDPYSSNNDDDNDDDNNHESFDDNHDVIRAVHPQRPPPRQPPPPPPTDPMLHQPWTLPDPPNTPPNFRGYPDAGSPIEGADESPPPPTKEDPLRTDRTWAVYIPPGSPPNFFRGYHRTEFHDPEAEDIMNAGAAAMPYVSSDAAGRCDAAHSTIVLTRHIPATTVTDTVTRTEITTEVRVVPTTVADTVTTTEVTTEVCVVPTTATATVTCLHTGLPTTLGTVLLPLPVTSGAPSASVEASGG